MVRIIETVTLYQDQPDCKTADEMEQLCCVPTEALECCERIEPNWAGYTQEEILDKLGLSLDDHGRDSQGRYVNVELQPRTHPCGEKRTKYDLTGENCCDEVDPLEIDTAESAQVVADNSSCIIYLKKSSTKPFLVSIRGEGFYANADTGQKDLLYSDGALILVETLAACGICTVTINDGCSIAIHQISSINGKWGPIVGSQTSHEVAIEGLTATLYDQVAGFFYWIGNNYQYKQYELSGGTIGCGSSSCGNDCDDWCGSPSQCPLGYIGTYSKIPCYRLESVFADQPYWKLNTEGCSAGTNKGCYCSCVVGNWYQKWIC